MMMLRTLFYKFKHRQSDSILKHGMVYFGFFGLTTACNILFRKYASVNLTIEDFGIFTALLAFYSIITQPFGVLQMIITKRMSFAIGKNRPAEAFGFFDSILRVFLLLSFAGALLILGLSPILQEHYHLPTLFSVVLVVLMFLIANLASCYTGALQAFQRFAAIGSINAVITFIKLGATFVLLHTIYAGIHPAPLVLPDSFTHVLRIPVGPLYRYDIPLLGVLVSMLVLGLLSMLVLGSIRRREKVPDLPRQKVEVGPILREFFPIFILYVGFSLLKNLDEYVARHFLSEYENGLYGAIATVGKSSIFLVSTISFVTFPKFAAVADNMVATRRIMLKGLALGGAGILAAFSAIIIAPELLVQILTHSKYLEAAPDLKWFFLAFMPYPVTFLFINYFIVHHDWRYVIGLILGSGALVGGFQLFHAHINELFAVMGIAGYAILSWSAIFWWFDTKKRARVHRSR